MLERVWAWLRREADREIEDIAWKAARAREEAWNRGTWRDRRSWQVPVTVRWDRVVHHFFVAEVGKPETAWPNRDGLRRYLMALEGAGYVPDADNATRAIRARLDMPGWG